MKPTLVTAIVLLMAFPAMGANIARDGHVEAVPQNYTNQFRSGPYLVVSILNGAFTDLCGIYSGALGGASCIYDPFGNWGSPTDYGMIVYSTSDNWWTSYGGYSADMATAGSYMDAGGCLWISGQDFLYGGGSPAMNFVMNRMGVISVNQDVNFGDDTTLYWDGYGPLDGMSGNMDPCFDANPWFTDDVFTNSPVADWATLAGYWGQAGSWVDNGFFTTVEFACDEARIDEVVAALLVRLCAEDEHLLGACCFPDGHCMHVIEFQCQGDWLGAGTACDPNPCSQPFGACCFPDGSCVYALEADCQTGDWRIFEVCDPNPCGYGACCLEDGSCLYSEESGCHGDWLGFGTVCEPNPCPQPPGACCFPDGECLFVIEDDCEVDWLGFGTVCDPNPCPQPSGACCYADESCQYVVEADCPTGDWRIFEPCDPNPCGPPPGACCFEDGSCLYIPEAECGDGEWLGIGSVCDPNPCPQPFGACCYPDGSCLYRPENQCPGNWLGPDTDCDPNPCPLPLGACCLEDETCLYVTEAECDEGDWLGIGTVCVPNPCLSNPPGACCVLETGECILLTQEECESLAGTYYVGDHVPCDPNPCEPVPTIHSTWGRIKNHYSH